MATNGSSPQEDVIRHSVTKGDYEDTPHGAMAIWHISVPLANAFPGLPAYWSPYRDRILRGSTHLETMWANAVQIAVTKISTKDWRIEGRRIQYWHDLLLAADNHQTFASFQEKLARDFLLTDNGCFIEIVRTSSARGSRVLGLVPLDSRRCWRTPDEDVPVIYHDRQGIWHEMKDYQVLMLSDQPDQEFYGVGLCAASRNYPAVLELAGLETYTYEKITGKRAHRVYFVNANVNETQLQNAMSLSGQASNAKGYVVYQDAVIIPVLDPSAQASVAHLDLAGLPEGYDPDKERAAGYKKYAASLGYSGNTLDPQITALSRNSMGTGSQAQTLDDLEQEHGAITSYFTKFSAILDHHVLPPRVQFAWGGRDLRDAERQANVFKTTAEAVAEVVDKGVISPEQGKVVLVNRGELPSEFVTTQLIDGVVLSDSDKPTDADPDVIAANEEQGRKLIEAQTAATKPAPITKEQLIVLAEKAAAEQGLANYVLMQDGELLDWHKGRIPA